MRTLGFGLWTLDLRVRVALCHDLAKVFRGFARALKLSNQSRDCVNAAITIGERLHPTQSSRGVQLFNDLGNQAATQRQVFTIDWNSCQKPARKQGLGLFSCPPRRSGCRHDAPNQATKEISRKLTPDAVAVFSIQ